MKRYGLIGHPLKNTFSANYFNQRFKRETINALYSNYPLASIDELPSLLLREETLCGLNVTIPYKQSVIPFIHEMDESATAVGAVNTISIQNGKLTGYNTDVYGFEKSLLPLLKPWHQFALVLGTGGASKAVCFVLQKLGIKYNTVSRAAENGFTYTDIDKALIRSHQVIVNTTPVGMFPNANKAPHIPYEFITPLHLVYDLIYLPEETLFIKQAATRGAVTQNGLAMLHLQADKAWEIWKP